MANYCSEPNDVFIAFHCADKDEKWSLKKAVEIKRFLNASGVSAYVMRKHDNENHVLGMIDKSACFLLVANENVPRDSNGAANSTGLKNEIMRFKHLCDDGKRDALTDIKFYVYGGFTNGTDAGKLAGDKFRGTMAIVENGDLSKIGEVLNWLIADEKVTPEKPKPKPLSSEILDAKQYDEIKFGKYKQTKCGEVQPIEWIVLKRTSDYCICISKYILDCRQYHHILEPVRWRDCELRDWLNGHRKYDHAQSFYETAFDDSEKRRIMDTDTRDGIDKVFLLNEQETMEYLPVTKSKMSIGTEFAKLSKTSYAGRPLELWEKFGGAYWWLRDFDDSKGCAKAVAYEGEIKGGNTVTNDNFGVRVAIRINLTY